MAEEDPAPVRNPIPILIGGGGEKVTLKLTAQYADLWNGFGPPESWQHKNNVLTSWCEKVGRDPAAIERTVSIEEKDVPANLDAFAAAGATTFILGVGEPWNYDVIAELVRWRDAANE